MQRTALIFGDIATSRMIGQELSVEGFDPVYVRDFARTLGLDYSYLNNFIPDSPRGHPVFEDIRMDGLPYAPMRTLLAEFSRRSGGTGLIHPGTTEWAERPELADLCREVNLDLVAPSAAVLSMMRDKLNYLLRADAFGIPTLILRADPLYSIREIEALIEQGSLTFPFVLRAVKRGGRFGKYYVEDVQDLEGRLHFWCEQLRRKDGEVLLYAERHIEGARRIVLPFARFQDGGFQALPMTDATLRCLNRKFVEFCPATRINLGIRKQLVDWTRGFCAETGFVGVGAFEFSVDHARAYLVDASPRLGTHFHLWERVAQTRAVSWQLATLFGGFHQIPPKIKLEKNWVPGMTLRLCAEDPIFQLPQAGVIRELSFPESEEVKLNYRSGDTVSVSDSGLLGLVFISAQSRRELIQSAKEFLEKSWIAGSIQTNEKFLLELVSHPWVREGMFHSSFVDEDFLPATRPSKDYYFLAMAVCKEIYDKSPEVRWWVGDQCLKPDAQEVQTLRWVQGPEIWTLEGGKKGISGWLEGPIRVCAYPILDRWLVRLGTWHLTVRPVPFPREKVKGRPKLAALITGRVHAVLFLEGTRVPAHEPWVVLESMGVLVPHALPVSAQVMNWRIRPDDTVLMGQELAEIQID